MLEFKQALHQQPATFLQFLVSCTTWSLNIFCHWSDLQSFNTSWFLLRSSHFKALRPIFFFYRSDCIVPVWEGPTLPTDGNILRCLNCEWGASGAGGSREHPPSKGPLRACRTFEAGVEQVFPGVAEQGVCEDEVQGAQQQVVWVHQVVADHREVSWAGNNVTTAWGTNHVCRVSWWCVQTRLRLVSWWKLRQIACLLPNFTQELFTFSADVQHPAEVEDFAHGTRMASIKHKQRIF